MKKSTLLNVISKLGMSLSFLSVLLLAGCAKEPVPDPTLTIDVSEVTIAPEGETVNIPIVTNSNLSAPICSHDWFTAEFTENNSVLQITAGVSKCMEAREGTVTVKTNSGSEKEVSMTIHVEQGVTDDYVMGLTLQKFRFRRMVCSTDVHEYNVNVKVYLDGQLAQETSVTGTASVDTSFGEWEYHTKPNRQILDDKEINISTNPELEIVMTGNFYMTTLEVRKKFKYINTPTGGQWKATDGDDVLKPGNENYLYNTTGSWSTNAQIELKWTK